MSVFDYIDAHPVYTFFLGMWVLIVIGMGISLIQFLINRPLRHMNIRKHGYPPAHCDADGDVKPEKPAQQEKEVGGD